MNKSLLLLVSLIWFLMMAIVGNAAVTSFCFWGLLS